MGENETKSGSAHLYFAEPDGTYSPFIRITDTAIEYGTDLNDISTPIGSLGSLESLEFSFDVLAKEYQELMLAISGMYRALINCCPDKRVVHLAAHGKKARTRKKNRNRAIRILEEL